MRKICNIHLMKIKFENFKVSYGRLLGQYGSKTTYDRL